MRRALGETVEGISCAVQPKAEYLGHGLAMVRVLNPQHCALVV